MNDRESYDFFSRCADGTIVITALPEKKNYRFRTTDAEGMYRKVVELGKDTNVYISVNPRGDDLPDGARGGDDDVNQLFAIVADCDVFGEAHKEKELPPDKDSVISLLTSLPLKPTRLDDSGYGIYAYYIFETPYQITDEASMQMAKGTTEGFGRYLASEFSEKGWKLDNVFSISHMFRAPGSLNHKLDTPVPCRVIDFTGTFYSINDFSAYYKAPEPVRTEPFKADPRAVGSADRIMECCPFIQKLRDDPDSVTEPEWKAACSNIVLTPDGAAKFHEWSSLYTGYSPEETDRKIAQSVKANKPCTCKYICECLGFACPEEGCGVKAPVVHSLYSMKEQMENLLSSDSMKAENVFDPYTLKLASWAADNDPAAYGRLKIMIKKTGVGTRDFEKAVKHESEMRAEPEFGVEPTVINLSGISLRGAVEPPGYKLSLEDGITTTMTYNGEPVTVTLCGEPVVITSRLENIDTGQEMTELAFFRNKRWKTLRAPRSGIFNKNTLLRYADSGLLVSSDNSDEMVKYFTAYETANQRTIPFIRSIDRIGWVEKEFYPYVTKSKIIYEGDDADGIIAALRESGDYDLWLETAEEIRKSPVARAILAASFVSPLLKIMKHRIIILHVWYSSGSGKTAALKFALSVYGDPMKLMGNFNSTAVGMERRAGTLKHLPLGLDELQVLNERRLSSSYVVYSLGNGYGKTRGAKNGGLQDVPTWQNSIISTGEQPISNETSMDGVNTRVLEIYGQPVEGSEFGRKVHQISESNYGFAGKQYIGWLIDNVLPDPDKAEKDFTTLRDELKAKFAGEPGVHLDNIAALALADEYSSLAVFGLDEDEAHAEAISLGLKLLSNCKTMEKEDSIERAWHFVEGWVAENRACFDATSKPCYGKIEPDRVYIIASVLREALEKAGFSYTKCIRGFRDNDHIYVFEERGVLRSQCRKKILGVGVRVICAKLSVEPDTDDFRNEDDDEDFLN